LGSLKGGDHSPDLGVGGRTILKRILRKYNKGVGWIHLAHDRDRPLVGSCEYGNELSDSIRGREFPDQPGFSIRAVLHEVC
jgi:hypothetical protein